MFSLKTGYSFVRELTKIWENTNFPVIRGGPPQKCQFARWHKTNKEVPTMFQLQVPPLSSMSWDEESDVVMRCNAFSRRFSHPFFVLNIADYFFFLGNPEKCSWLKGRAVITPSSCHHLKSIEEGKCQGYHFRMSIFALWG